MTHQQHSPAIDDRSPTASLSDQELVALMIGKRASNHVRDGAGFLAAASYEELVEQGLKPAEAMRILAGFELAKRSRKQPAPKALRRPLDAYKLVMPIIDDPEREHFVVVVLDVQNRPRGVAVVGTGSIDQCLVDPRQVFQPAIRHSGSAVLLVHNHPSGDPTPSPEDIELTQRLGLAGALIGMPVLDHLIIATGPHVKARKRYASLAELGLMEGRLDGTASDYGEEDEEPAHDGRVADGVRHKGRKARARSTRKKTRSTRARRRSR